MTSADRGDAGTELEPLLDQIALPVVFEVIRSIPSECMRVNGRGFCVDDVVDEYPDWDCVLDADGIKPVNER